MNLKERLERIARLDQLIRLKATGKPADLAKRLGISERSVYELLNEMRHLGAQIEFNAGLNSYCYVQNVRFQYGFVGYSHK